MKKVQSTITVQKKKHTYTLSEKKAGVVHVSCPSANIDQDFLAEDVAALLIDLPNLIAAERDYKKNQSEVIRFRVSSEDKNKVERKAVQEGFGSVSDYLRHLALG